MEEVGNFAGPLKGHVGGFKVGLEFITAVGPRDAVNSVRGYDANVFYDGKFMDIPNTVARAVRNVTRLGVHMLNVHCLGGPAMLRAAVEAAANEAATLQIERPKVLGVTVLTSLEDRDLRAMGIQARVDPDDHAFALADEDRGGVEIIVTHLARLAKECGLDGVIASPREIAALRQACGPSFLIVTPDVRPTWAETGDQKRVMTPGAAISAGADYLVIGRPMTQPPKEIGGPAEAAKRITDKIAAAAVEKGASTP